MPQEGSDRRAQVEEAYRRLGGNISAIARELGVDRSTVRNHARKLGISKPLVGGQIDTKIERLPLPAKGQLTRYILTAAQNNTKVHERLWTALQTLSAHLDAKILVGTYSYNMNAYGKLSVKRGNNGTRQTELWYDDRLEPYFSDHHLELAPGLLWCGEMNIMPTNVDPLSGLETYSGRKSGIFPHPKQEMRSIATMMGEGTKLNYTTGAVTQLNYIQKKAGIVAEHHHVYGALIVEIDSFGHWWVRQLQVDEKGRVQDLDVLVDGDKLTTGNRVEAITWGDLHATVTDPIVERLSAGEGGMLDVLKPRYQFVHDALEGASINHHAANNPHEKYKSFLRGLHTVSTEMAYTVEILRRYARPFCQTLVVDSNHDSQWLMKWLREHDYRRDPANAIFFLELQLAVYKALACHVDIHPLEHALRSAGCPDEIRFLQTDESFTICNKRIECGMHGHLGPDGARGNARNLQRVGRRANIGHVHSAGIFGGLFAAGTSSKLDMGFNKGPSSWTHSHVVTYPNGRRTIVTMFAGKWRG